MTTKQGPGGRCFELVGVGEHILGLMMKPLWRNACAVHSTQSYVLTDYRVNKGNYRYRGTGN